MGGLYAPLNYGLLKIIYTNLFCLDVAQGHLKRVHNEISNSLVKVC